MSDAASDTASEVARKSQRLRLSGRDGAGGSRSLLGADHADGTSRWLTASRTGLRWDVRSERRGVRAELPEYMTIR